MNQRFAAGKPPARSSDSDGLRNASSQGSHFQTAFQHASLNQPPTIWSGGPNVGIAEGKDNHHDQSWLNPLWVFIAAMLAFAPNAKAQFPAPPQIGVEPPQLGLPAKDPSAEVEKMTKRYVLSDDQTKNVRTILEEQARKADDVAKNDSLAPEEKVHRMLAIKDEEITRASDALTPEQRKKYLADVRPAPPAMSPPPGGAAKE